MSSGWEFKNNGNDIGPWGLLFMFMLLVLLLAGFITLGCASKVVVKNCKPGIPFAVLAKDTEGFDLDQADYICEEL